jgi:hypothetical protein
VIADKYVWLLGFNKLHPFYINLYKEACKQKICPKPGYFMRLKRGLVFGHEGKDNYITGYNNKKRYYHYQ